MEVVTVVAPETTQMAFSEEDQASIPEEVTQLSLEPSRMKWFDKDKGFGFANVFGRPEDVFVHVEVLRASGFADLQAGEAVCLRIIEGKRGRMAVQVVSWESSVRREFWVCRCGCKPSAPSARLTQWNCAAYRAKRCAFPSNWRMTRRSARLA